MEELLFNLANWLIAYKYWEVSWTVPIQLKGIQPSATMRSWLKCGHITGIVTLVLGEVLVGIAYQLNDLDFSDNSCFLEVFQNETIFIQIARFLILSCQITTMGFFADSFRRIYKELRG